MIRVIGFGGEPATGKSALMCAVINNWLRLTGGFQMVKSGTVVAMAWPVAKVIILGYYAPGETFGGTDRLPMNVQPEAKRYLEALAAAPQWDGWLVLFEGDRLFNGKFLQFCQQRFQSRFFAIRCSPEEKARRHALRADSQDKTWLRGRETKVANLIREFGLPVLEHNNAVDTERLSMLLVEGKIWELNVPILQEKLAL